MTKFSVCIDAVFNGLPSEEALRATRDAGFSTFEFWSWWDKDLDQIANMADKLSLTPVVCCTRFISLVDPAKRDNYLVGLEESIEAAQKLGIKKLISQTGNDLGTSTHNQTESVIEGLLACLPLLEQSGMELLLEPLNVRVDHPGYFLTSSDDAFKIVRAVGSPHVNVLFDIYHQQITEGNLIPNIDRCWSEIGYMQCGDNPGRKEPGTGEINYRNVFRHIHQKGFQGIIGMEHGNSKKGVEGEQAVIDAYVDADNF